MTIDANKIIERLLRMQTNLTYENIILKEQIELLKEEIEEIKENNRKDEKNVKNT